ncbi:MAG: prepilin-type N-terminal cleavage/methylation domain-containing protein [Candidatus Riflebacteria bacterium]|nr:prepilin-type N-terminal cleavage/methylation domain-containing protein [Candidatus Riflebacteria bacterium]
MTNLLFPDWRKIDGCATLEYMSERHLFTQRRGFTLPEVLITILLISILFTLGIIFTTGLRSTSKMRNSEIAIVLAQQAIEVLRAAPYSMIDDADASDSVELDLNTDSGPNDLLKPVLMAGPIKYERKVEVTELPNAVKDGMSPRLKFVRVIVTWGRPEEKKVTFELSTTIADLN